MAMRAGFNVCPRIVWHFDQLLFGQLLFDQLLFDQLLFGQLLFGQSLFFEQSLFHHSLSVSLGPLLDESVIEQSFTTTIYPLSIDNQSVSFVTHGPVSP